MFSAFLAAIMNPIEVIGAKEVMKKERVNFGAFASVNMAFIFFLGLIPFFIWGNISPQFFTLRYLLYFFMILIFGFLHNVFYFKSLSKADLCDIEPIAMLEPLASVLLAAAVFSSERNWTVLILAIVASLALAVSRFQRKKIKFNIYLWAMVGYVICFAVEGIFVKLALEAINPVALYILRVGVLTSMLLLFFKPNLKIFGKKRTRSILLIATVVLIEFFSRYYAISKIGIVESSLIFMLGPVLVLLFSKFYLKEKYTLKTVLADAIIVICVGALAFLN